jgi:hypothetical protein
MVEKEKFINKIIQIHEAKTGEVLSALEAQELFENLVRLTSVVLEYD